VVRGQYQRRGQQREIPTPGTNCKEPVFGFLNVRTGAWHYWLTARNRMQSMPSSVRSPDKRLYGSSLDIRKSRSTKRRPRIKASPRRLSPLPRERKDLCIPT